MQLIPYNDRVIIKPDQRETVSKGGIIIPETAQDRPIRGTVVAVGPGTLLQDGTREPLIAQVGDTIYFGKYAGTEFKLDGELHLLIREVDIICAVKDSEVPGALNFQSAEPVSIENVEGM